MNNPKPEKLEVDELKQFLDIEWWIDLKSWINYQQNSAFFLNFSVALQVPTKRQQLHTTNPVSQEQ